MPQTQIFNNWRDYRATFLSVGGLLVLGLCLLLLVQGTSTHKFTATLLALAFWAAGAAVGFLFGIPRVLQSGSIPTENQAGTAEQGNPDNPIGYRMVVNTNLEQISDWLTKIIVGLGLIHLHQVGPFLRRLATYISGDIASRTNVGLAIALILYFSILGFLGGYLMTRLYLAGAFRRADDTLNIGGSTLTVTEATAQQRNLIKDIQSKILDLEENLPLKARATADAAASIKQEASAVKTILWVDDNPKNNASIIANLNDRNIEVVTALSTKAALKLLESRRFDRIISDMGRLENGIYRRKAGIELTREVKPHYPETPIVIFCSSQAAKENRAEALEAGAAGITASSMELLESLRL